MWTRHNTSSLQSWWVDTGILVNAGNSLTINAANPGGVIRPWGTHPGFSPAGDANIANNDWPESLAYRTSSSVTEIRFGSLIGKIGRDGAVFPIGQLTGQSKTFNPTTTGTLFLAFNDGVNFEDNSGYWSVSITFEEFVQLSPTIYGTGKVIADRINTSFIDNWGIILTVEQGVPSTLSWNPTATDNLAAAFNNIQNRLVMHGGYTFAQVYTGLELRLTAASGAGDTILGNGNFVRFGTDTQGSAIRRDDRSWGRISPIAQFDYYPSTTGYGFFNTGDNGIQNTIIHELGHIVAYRTYNTPNSMLTFADTNQMNLKPMPDLAWNSRATDAPKDIGTFWENLISPNDLNEKVADNFLNWVRNSYIGIENNIDNFASAVTPEQQRAAAYWIGHIQFTDPNTHISSTSPGISVFAQQAATYVTNSNAAALLRSLGPGDADPNCLF